jgi:hypothetical protein
MLRLFKALPLVFAIASLCLFAASCGSSGQSQVRVVQAISDEQTSLDVKVNTSTPFTNIAFSVVQPAPPAYTKVASGSVTLEAVDTGTTTAVIANTNATFNGSSQYTVVMTGFLTGSGTTAPTFWTIPDTNTAPTAGNVEFRIINASTSSSALVGGFDVYIVPPGTVIQNTSGPQVSGLTLGQGSAYISLPFVVNIGYEVVVTGHGNFQGGGLPNQTYVTPTSSIRTLVIVDNSGGAGGVSLFPLVLNDLN